jgi:hypothetical protein
VKRREFITFVGGAVAWPLAARAQQGERMRQIGMLVSFNDPDIKAFQDELEKHGWSDGRNIHVDYRVAPAGAQVQPLAKSWSLRNPMSFSRFRDRSPPRCRRRPAHYRSCSLTS